jgi:hypothetical protein
MPKGAVSLPPVILTLKHRTGTTITVTWDEEDDTVVTLEGFLPVKPVYELVYRRLVVNGSSSVTAHERSGDSNSADVASKNGTSANGATNTSPKDRGGVGGKRSGGGEAEKVEKISSAPTLLMASTEYWG